MGLGLRGRRPARDRDVRGQRRPAGARAGRDRHDWAQVSAGWQHSAALKEDGSLWVWGNAAVGDGTSWSASPLQVSPGIRWARVAAGGYHTLGVEATHGLVAWGDNGSGQLGIGSWDDHPTPFPVAVP